jgi:hypothetical protein
MMSVTLPRLGSTAGAHDAAYFFTWLRSFASTLGSNVSTKSLAEIRSSSHLRTSTNIRSAHYLVSHYCD